MKLYPDYTAVKLGFDMIRAVAIESTQTIYGREVLAHIKPLSNPIRIKNELLKTKEMMLLNVADGQVPFDNFSDIRSELKHSQIEGYIIEAEHLFKIATVLTSLKRVRTFLVNRSELVPHLSLLAQPLYHNQTLTSIILSAIDSDGYVKDTASDDLRRIRKQIQSKKNQIRNSLNDFAKQAARSGMHSDEGITLRNGRLVVPIKSEYKRQVNGLIHDESATGHTVYFEPAQVIQFNNEIRTLEAEEKREIQRILLAFTQQLKPYSNDILNSLTISGEIDAIQAKSILGKRLTADIPLFKSGKHLNLINAKNPVLLLKELQKKKSDRNAVIPFTLELSVDEKCLVLTGPNAGGKSVTLKTVGLFALMLACGFPITAENESTFPLFSSLFVDMGDDQSIENDLSTFSSRLTILKAMLTHADNNSLILIDEAGTGTDPDEGSALYQAVIEALIEKEAQIIVTTHHGKIKAFVHEHPNAVNGSMEFDQNKLIPTYRFNKGIPGSSFAFEIAHTMQLPNSVIDKARIHLGERSVAVESLISQLEKERRDLHNQKNKQLEERDLAHKIKESYEKKIDKLNESAEKIKEKAIAEADQIINQANAKIERVIQEIVEKKADKESIIKAHSEVTELKKSLTFSKQKLASKKKKFEKENEKPMLCGDSVQLTDSGQIGEIIEIKGKIAHVLINGLKVITKRSNLRHSDTSIANKSKKVPTFTSDNTFRLTSSRLNSNRLDIRGQRVDEALGNLILFIDSARVSNFNEIEIIHGKGTGTLREAVQSHLKADKRITHFEDAPWNQGGPGCTIAFL